MVTLPSQDKVSYWSCSLRPFKFQILNQHFVFLWICLLIKSSNFKLSLNRRGKNQIWFPAFFELSLSKALVLTSHFSLCLAELSGWLGWLLSAVNCSHLWRTSATSARWVSGNRCLRSTAWSSSSSPSRPKFWPFSSDFLYRNRPRTWILHSRIDHDPWTPESKSCRF